MGQFSIDLETALARLRSSQVQNQHHYLHRVLRCAMLCGASVAQITCSHSRVRVSFPGAALEPARLEQFFDVGLLSKQIVLRELSSAVNLALAFESVHLEVRICDGQLGRVLQVKSQGKEHEVRVFDVPVGAPETTFQMQRKIGLGLTRIGTESPEYFAVHQRFRFTPVRITINRKLVDTALTWGGKLGPSVQVARGFLSLQRAVYHENRHAIEIRVRHPRADLNGLSLPPSQAISALSWPVGDRWLDTRDGWFLALGLSVNRRKASTASFVYWGETLQVFPVSLELPGVELLISAQGLDLDLSGEKLIENEAFEARWRLARVLFQQLAQALARAYPKAQGHQRVVEAIFDSTHRWRPHFDYPELRDDPDSSGSPECRAS